MNSFQATFDYEAKTLKEFSCVFDSVDADDIVHASREYLPIYICIHRVIRVYHIAILIHKSDLCNKMVARTFSLNCLYVFWRSVWLKQNGFGFEKREPLGLNEGRAGVIGVFTLDG